MRARAAHTAAAVIGVVVWECPMWWGMVVVVPFEGAVLSI